jgi:hypothetical protein
MMAEAGQGTTVDYKTMSKTELAGELRQLGPDGLCNLPPDQQAFVWEAIVERIDGKTDEPHNF